MVKLPSYTWFLGNLNLKGPGNVYTGSCGCSPETGNNCGKVFRYRAWFDKAENGYILKAACYSGLNAYDATDKSDITEKDFEASEQGIEEAAEWISSNILL